MESQLKIDVLGMWIHVNLCRSEKILTDVVESEFI